MYFSSQEQLGEEAGLGAPGFFLTSAKRAYREDLLNLRSLRTSGWRFNRPNTSIWGAEPFPHSFAA